MSDLSVSLKPFVTPWYQSLAKPEEAQEDVLRRLVQAYSKTGYGEKHEVHKVERLEDYRSLFPVVSYVDLQPYLQEVRRGDYSALLSEPVVRWVMTRGTTGMPKLIPATKTHLSQILSVGARGLINFALRKRDYEVLEGDVLNLNFPSEVGSIHTSRGDESYGYSSGTYAKLNPSLAAAKLVPRQEEIDNLGGGITKEDWDDRFELVYQTAKNKEIKSVMGVTPVISAFARYVRGKHHILPRELWHLKGLFCTSVSKIQTIYAPHLKHLYGEAPVVEMYAATEGVFAQQLDDYPYVCPNYDIYLFEAKTGRGVKMLYEMKPGEWGRIIISSPLFPRYDIGDMIEAFGRNHFRIFGRAKRRTVLEHTLFNILAGRFI